jgi:hypothetical protein
VSISGSGFTGGSAVTFNGTAAAFTVNSDTQITATVPSGASSGPIGVTAPGGTATSGGSFSVTTPPPASVPTITGFAPTSGRQGTSVTIDGTGFNGATSVTFNGRNASFTVLSATQIRATAPNGGKTGPIRVTTPGGTATSSTNFVFTK